MIRIALSALFICTISCSESEKAAKENPTMEQAVLYIHLQIDGGIVAMREDGKMMNVSVAQLREELAAVMDAEGSLLYSREDPQSDPPEHLNAVFREIIGYELPIKLLEHPHPAMLEKDPEYFTPLMGAAFRKDNDWVAELVSRGVALEEKDSYGQTALMFAANAGNAEGVKTLLEAGAYVDSRDNQNSTPLMFAAQHGFHDTVAALLSAGADVTAKGDHGLTAIGFAEQNGHQSIVQLLKNSQPSKD